MSESNLDHLLLFCLGWWVFASIVAFAAAALFWNKGASQLTGPTPGVSRMAVKLTGAGAIWGFTLIVFFFVNPTRVYSDAKGLLLVTVREQLKDGPMGNPSIEVQSFPGVDFSNQSLSIELIPRDSIFTLMPEGDNRFAYWKPIPAGVYELRITDISTGKRRSQQLTVRPQ
ncbi:MAG: hypothetical protein DMF53_01380 [Acidobacteria bacterium]|nr:MAG: hypothetical protein DMF53_01380 [Acidobacteriota bacterium]